MTSSSHNALARASSSYLRSAMHQPILLDIGAVWCHWCHVMDRESYDDPEVAKIVNENYIAVKVDRDERPDIDSRYQAAISSLTGQGGWPLTGFLTPDGKPFYGGTYFPPQEQYGRPSFKRVLRSIAQSYRDKNGEVVEQADMVTRAISQAESFSGHSGDVSPKVIDAIIESALKMFDERNGGFGNAPKFPHPSTLDLLIDRYARTGSEDLREVIVTTLEKMARGGVYDQLAGGFHRYSVDERWLVPHFEKMSYDNSELLRNYLHGWQATRNLFLKETAVSIISWVNQELSDQAAGGFYASQDADVSLDDDGDYFTWTLGELRAALSLDEARVMELYYDVEAHGEMHHNPEKNVLWIARGAAEIAKSLGLDESKVRLTIASSKRKLLAARKPRPTPFIDKTMYVSWNAMFVSTYFNAARTLEGELAANSGSFALKTIDRMLREAWSEENGFAHRIGGPALRGSLDDQVFGVLALLDAYEATLDAKYFRAAQRTMDLAIEKYGDAENGGFFDRASDAPAMGGLEVRRKPFQDSPTPSANSVASMALTRMHAYTDDIKYFNWAKKTLEAFAGIAPQYGLFAATYGLAALLFAEHPTQVVITGTKGDAAANKLERAANEVFRFGKAVLRVTPTTSLEHLPVALRQAPPHLPKDKPSALVCSGNTCLPPTSDPEELKRLLQKGIAGTAVG